MSSSPMETLRLRAISTLTKYRMDALISPYDTNKINDLLKANLALVQLVDSFEKGRAMISLKLGVDPTEFVTMDDCMELYNVFASWRVLLLETQVPVAIEDEVLEL